MAASETDIAAEQARIERERMAEPVKTEELRPGEVHEPKAEEDIRRMLKDFNSLPEILKTWYFEGVSVQMKRANVEIDSDRKMLIGSIKFYIMKPGHDPIEFEPKDFITRFGSQTKRKFVSLFMPLIGEVANELSMHVVEFNDAREMFLEKYHIGRGETTVVRQPITRSR